MKLRLNKAHFPIHGLGPGQRLGIWFQGCSIRCSGCVSLDTWGRRPETTVSADEVVAWCQSHLIGGADGITVSGGEPFDQPKELQYIIEQLRAFASRNALQFDVLCYTGLPFSVVEEKYTEILSLLDAIVSEPFEESSPTDRYLCGSENQVLRILSERGRMKYQSSKADPQLAKRMDVSVSDASVFLSGIPRDDDLARLRQAMKARGVNLGKVSWRD